MGLLLYYLKALKQTYNIFISIFNIFRKQWSGGRKPVNHLLVYSSSFNTKVQEHPGKELTHRYLIPLHKKKLYSTS